MNLAKFAIEKRVISALATLLIISLGYFAYTKLPRFEDPEFIIRQAKIITPYPGASAEEVASEVTDTIEDAIQQLQGVKEVKSTSTPGVSEVTVEFTIASAKTRPVLNQKFAQLRAKILDIESQLPPNAIAPTVYDDFGDVYALYFAITGDGYSITELKDYAKKLKKQLVLVPGVSKVLLVGDPQEVIYLEYDPVKLTQLGLSSGQVAQLIEGQNLITPAGSVVTGTTRTTIRPSAGVPSIKSIEDVILTSQGGQSIRLKDIATVRLGLKDPSDKMIFRNGERAIGLGISNTVGGNVVNMGEAVKKRIAELEDQRPIGIELSPISDQSASVKTSVDDFVLNVLLALIIVIGTLLVFMGLRSGILMGGILLVTIAGTLFGMYAYGLDMQRISLGALIIALGMLVDNAIVVVEGTLVRVQKGEDSASAAITVVEQTKWPLLGGTVVGFLAFSAIGFSPDNTGEYAGSLFWTITIALLFSWLVAVWLTPYFCTLLLKPDTKKAQGQAKEHFILSGYRKVLTLALSKRWVTIGFIVALFVSAIMSSGYMKQGFFPSSTRAQFVVDYNLAEGSTEIQVKNDLQEISQWIRSLDGVTGTNTAVGGGHLRFMLTYSSESNNSAYGQILIDVEEFDVIEGLIGEVQHHMDSNYPQAISKAWKFVLGPSGGSVLEAKFSGPDPVVLRKLSEQAKDILRNVGAIGVKDDWGNMTKIIRPKINNQNARRAGLSQEDISKAIAAHFDGTVIGIYRDGDELIQINYRPKEKARKNIKSIRDVQVFSSTSGRYIPITQVVDSFDIAFENAKLKKIDRALSIIAQADPAPGENATAVFNKIKPQVEAIELPSGYELEWKGEFGSSAEANSGLATTMPFGFGAMIIVVILLFNAIRQPLIIWLTVPLALIGVVYGLIAFGTTLEFMGILAILSLTGMLIKNAIVLIDQTDTEIEEGKPRMSAIIDAAVSRVRPVSLGVLTTVLGVVPLIWDPFFKSLAVVIICGLSFATILTLIIVPTLYAVFFKVDKNEVS